MDPSSDIINTVDRLYNFNSLASVGYGDTTLASIYHTAAESTLVPTAIGVLKAVSFLVCTLLLALIVIVFLKIRELNGPGKKPEDTIVVEDMPEEEDEVPAPQTSRPVSTSSSPGWLAARWGEISRHMESAKEAEWRFAIVEADKMVDDVLKRAGYPGGTLGERLTNMQPGQIETLDGLWFAHKVRNRIAHDMDYFLRYTEAKQVIRFFEATLREFKAI